MSLVNVLSMVVLLLLDSANGFLLCQSASTTTMKTRCQASTMPPPTEQLEESLGARIRSQFPALDQEVSEGKPLIYLDSGATSQKPQCVLDAMEEYYRKNNANVHRGAHTLATRATEAYESARQKIADFIGASSSREIVFTRGATEAVNLVANGWGESCSEGDEIVMSVAEHHANVVPWQMLAERKGLVLKFAKIDENTGCVDEAHLAGLVTPKTRMIALFHVSNVLGCSSPVEVAVEAARTQPDCAVLLDACQSVPHGAVDVSGLGVDFLVASSHKMCGPTGIGFLWGKYDRLDAMVPWQGGGEMIDTVTLEGTTFSKAPAKFEAGTPAIAEAVGLGAACDFLTDIGMGNIAAYEQQLAKKLDRDIRSVPGVTVYGPPEGRRTVPLVAFNVDGIHASDLSFFLDQEGVATRAGHHCAQPLHHALDIDSGSVRASLSFYNTPDEIDAFIRHLRSVIDFFADVGAAQ